MNEKTYLDEISHSRYDFRYAEDNYFKVDQGLNENIVLEISRERR